MILVRRINRDNIINSIAITNTEKAKANRYACGSKERGISSVSTNSRRNNRQITQASGAPNTAPAVQEAKESSTNSRVSRPLSCLRDAPNAIKMPVSRDLYRKNNPDA
ncbi:hypothetical protein D3C73_877470 [compost metagenome]